MTTDELLRRLATTDDPQRRALMVDAFAQQAWHDGQQQGLRDALDAIADQLDDEDPPGRPV